MNLIRRGAWSAVLAGAAGIAMLSAGAAMLRANRAHSVANESAAPEASVQPKIQPVRPFQVPLGGVPGGPLRPHGRFMGSLIDGRQPVQMAMQTAPATVAREMTGQRDSLTFTEARERIPFGTRRQSPAISHNVFVDAETGAVIGGGARGVG